MTINLPEPLPVHQQWWVVKTRAGYRPIDHEPRARGVAIGPFVGALTANVKIEELEAAESRRRAWRRLSAGVAFLAALVAVTQA